MKLRERDLSGKVCARQNEKSKRENIVSLLKTKNIKKVTVKKVTEKYTLDEQLPEAKLELGHKTKFQFKEHFLTQHKLRTFFGKERPKLTTKPCI